MADHEHSDGASLWWFVVLMLVLVGAVVASFAYSQGHHDACDSHCVARGHHHGRFGSAGPCVCFDYAGDPSP